MALARVKNWVAEALLYSDLNAEFNNILNNPGDLISGCTATNLTLAGVTTESPRAASYQYTPWDPSDVAGTGTNAPATATASLSASDYITMGNSGGTLTLTFAKAGNYLINIYGHNEVAAAPTAINFNAAVGGSATRYLGPTTLGLIKSSSDAGNQSGTASFMVQATASQTLTILPSISIVGAGATTNYTCNCSVSAAYCGSS